MCLDRRWHETQDNSYLHVFSDRPISFDTISEGMNPSLNGTVFSSVSSDGIAFWADHEPRMNAIISVELDDRALANCSEVEHDMLQVDGRVIGKVSSIERNDLTSEVIVKVAFLKQNSRYVPEARQTVYAA